MSLESINFQPLARFQRKKYRLFKKINLLGTSKN